MAEQIAGRAKARVQRLFRERKFKQAHLARELGMSPQSAHDYVEGPASITLPVIEAVSRLTGVPEAELIVPDGSLIKQLDANEAAVVRYMRAWGPGAASALADFLRHFSGERVTPSPPAVKLDAATREEIQGHLAHLASLYQPATRRDGRTRGRRKA